MSFNSFRQLTLTSLSVVLNEWNGWDFFTCMFSKALLVLAYGFNWDWNLWNIWPFKNHSQPINHKIWFSYSAHYVVGCTVHNVRVQSINESNQNDYCTILIDLKSGNCCDFLYCLYNVVVAVIVIAAIVVIIVQTVIFVVNVWVWSW